MGKEEVLKRIREAERLVREMLDETEKEREAMLIQARREADRIVEEGLAEVDQQTDGVFEQARAEIQRTVQGRIEEGQAAVEERRSTSTSRLPRAVDHLVREFERSTLSD
jgi:vacuolar-type H+-ATPase subunit H